MKSVIKRPIITEKNTILNGMGVYTFEVDSKSTKTEVKKAIEKLFSVKVDSVNTSVCRSHTKRNKYGITQPLYWKKAMVKLIPGEKISLFEGA